MGFRPAGALPPSLGGLVDPPLRDGPRLHIPDLEAPRQAFHAHPPSDFRPRPFFAFRQDGAVFHEETRKLVTKGLGHWAPPEKVELSTCYWTNFAFSSSLVKG